jgi:hypothetical protein
MSFCCVKKSFNGTVLGIASLICTSQSMTLGVDQKIDLTD